MLHLFKAIVGTARIPQRIVRTTLCAVWRPSQPSHYNSRDLADELRRRQLSLSGQKGRDNLTDMVRSMATAPRADPADQSESDSEFLHDFLDLFMAFPRPEKRRPDQPSFLAVLALRVHSSPQGHFCEVKLTVYKTVRSHFGLKDSM